MPRKRDHVKRTITALVLFGISVSAATFMIFLNHDEALLFPVWTSIGLIFALGLLFRNMWRLEKRDRDRMSKGG